MAECADKCGPHCHGLKVHLKEFQTCTVTHCTLLCKISKWILSLNMTEPNCCEIWGMERMNNNKQYRVTVNCALH